MILLRHFSKKDMKDTLIGQPLSKLRYSETSMFGAEVSDNCKVTGAHRPYYGALNKYNPKTGKPMKSKEFFATITIKDGVILAIS